MCACACVCVVRARACMRAYVARECVCTWYVCVRGVCVCVCVCVCEPVDGQEQKVC